MPRTFAILLLLAIAGTALWLALRDRNHGGAAKTGAPPPVAPAGDLTFSFVDVAGPLGYTMRNRSGSETAKNFILEAMPPGIAVADFDGDGWMDLYCPNGNQIVSIDPRTKEVTLLPPEEAPRNELFRNRGGKGFERVGKAAGVDDPSWSYGAVAGDIDNDGDPDLFVCNFGRNKLYLNDGTGRFTEVAEAAGAAGHPRHWATGACFFDFDNDGDLDIYVAQYADMYDFFANSRHVTIGPNGEFEGRSCDWKGLKVYCGPLGLLPLNDVLLENRLAQDGELKFRDVTKEKGLWIEADAKSRSDISRGPYYGFQPVAWDMDGDGFQDVFVANDSVNNLCWMSDGGKKFVDRALEMSLALSQDDHTPQASMGVGVGDINNDGLFDIVVSEFSHDQFNLLLAERTRSGLVVFDEKASRSGLRRMTFFKLGWGSNLFDVDLDGDLDMFFACGHVYPEVSQMPAQETTYRQANVLILTQDPQRLRLEDVSNRAGPGLGVVKATRASVAFDMDNDGDLDLATTELNDSPSLLRCDTDPAAGRHWLMVRLKGRPAAGIPLDAPGTVVSVRAGGIVAHRVHLIGSSFQSSEDPRLHFGLGDRTKVDSLTVKWPNGQTTRLEDVPVDRVISIEYPDDSE